MRLYRLLRRPFSLEGGTEDFFDANQKRGGCDRRENILLRVPGHFPHLRKEEKYVSRKRENIKETRDATGPILDFPCSPGAKGQSLETLSPSLRAGPALKLHDVKPRTQRFCKKETMGKIRLAKPA